MKPYLLAFTCLLALSANSQSKEVVFKRIDSIIQRTNGFKSSQLSIIKQQFSEKLIRIEGADDKGERSVGEFSKIKWKGMDFSLEPMEGVNGLIKVTIDVKEEASFNAFANGNKIDEEELDEVFFFIREADKDVVKKELGQLAIHTWPELSSISKMDKEALTSYIKASLNKAGQEYEISVKSINECEIVFKDGNIETTVPTKISQIHLDSNGEAYQLCYGKSKAQFIYKEGNKIDRETAEHPDIELDIQNSSETTIPLAFAFRLLAKMCQR